jgi:hypothetical protein
MWIAEQRHLAILVAHAGIFGWQAGSGAHPLKQYTALDLSIFLQD